MDFLAIIKAVILGIIEGLTEFLPVSSTGHLIIADKFLTFGSEVFTESFANTFNIIIQTGAIIAVIIYFRKKIFPRSLEYREISRFLTLWCKVVVAVIPAIILGLLFDDFIDSVLFKPVPVAIALIVGAFLLIYVENKNKKRPKRRGTEDDITYKQALLVGIAQCMALFPGMSRSASTIIGGMFFGLSRTVATEFSFFLAIPTLMGAGLYKGMKAGFNFTPEQWMATGIGLGVSFVVAYGVIALFMSYIQKRDLKPFAYYRIALGVVVLLVGFFLN